MDNYRQMLINLGLYGVNPQLLQFANYMKDRNINNPNMFNVYDRLGNFALGNINRANGRIGNYPYMSPYIKE